MLGILDAQDDDTFFLVQEITFAVYGFNGFLLILFHCDQRHLLNARKAVRGSIAGIGGDGPVRLPQDPEQEVLMAVVEPACKHGGRGAPFAHNGEAVLLHQELVDEGPVPCVELVVVAGKLADGEAEALEDRVKIVDKGAENAGNAEVACIVACDDMCPVHGDKIGYKLGIVCDAGQVCPGKALPEVVLVHVWQARKKGLHVLHNGLLVLCGSLFCCLG